MLFADQESFLFSSARTSESILQAHRRWGNGFSWFNAKLLHKSSSSPSANLLF